MIKDRKIEKEVDIKRHTETPIAMRDRPNCARVGNTFIPQNNNMENTKLSKISFQIYGFYDTFLHDATTQAFTIVFTCIYNNTSHNNKNNKQTTKTTSATTTKTTSATTTKTTSATKTKATSATTTKTNKQTIITAKQIHLH